MRVCAFPRSLDEILGGVEKFVSELFSSVVNGLLFVLLTLRNMSSKGRIQRV